MKVYSFAFQVCYFIMRTVLLKNSNVYISEKLIVSSSISLKQIHCYKFKILPPYQYSHDYLH